MLLIALWLCGPATLLAQAASGTAAWISSDIGSPVPPGTTSISGSTFTLTGQGYFSGTQDSGRFCYQPLTGDGALVARVTALTGTDALNNSANAGVMIRAATTRNSQMVYVDVTHGFGKYCIVRSLVSGTAASTTTGNSAIPYWVKVVRTGGTFSGYISPDGGTWTQLGTPTAISMPNTVNIGLAATSNAGDTVTATFDNVSLTSLTGSGCGLSAEYFNSANLTSRVFTRIDSGINFNWSGTTPAPAITSQAFSVRWTGTIIPPTSDTYTFAANLAGGGARVWVYPVGTAGSPIIDNWTGGGSGIGSVPMTTGSTYRIQVDYTSAGQAKPGISLSWANATQASQVIPGHQLLPAYPGKGRVLVEKWLGLSGSNVSSLTSLSSYPNHPSGRHFLTSLNIENTLGGTNYGDKMRGYIYPPETGTYTFVIAGADEAQLWMSPNELPTNLVKLCNVPAASFTGYLQWNKYPSQTGTASLAAGRAYYFEVLHKEGTDPDNCAVGWTTPSGIVEQPIPGERVAPFEAVTSVVTGTAMFNTLATEHPRLYTDAQGFAAIKADALTTSPAPTQRNLWYVGLNGTAATATGTGRPASGSLLYTANSLFGQPPTPQSPDGSNYYSNSYLNAIRQVLSRASTLGMVYQLSGNPWYANRAYEEFLCVSGSTVTPNPGMGDTWVTGTSGAGAAWNIWSTDTNDLDYAELLNACAIGYDWLYHGLSSTQVSVLEKLTSKAMGIQYAYYEAAKSVTNSGNAVYYGSGNHTDVDIGGACTSALAIANDPATPAADTTACVNIMNDALLAAQTSGCFQILAPDGCDPESPDYHMYLTTYLGYGFGALETANAGDMGLIQQPGQAKLGGYPLGIMGPRSMINYNDCWDLDDVQYSPAEFWYGWKFDQSFDAWSETHTAAGAPTAFDLLWYDSRGMGSGSATLSSPYNIGAPLDSWYRTSDIMTFRTSYPNPVTAYSSTSDPYGLFAAIKGGDNTTGHAHLAQGTFLIQCNGIEWASLLGFDNYSLPEYFQDDPAYKNSPQNRWEYYRCRAEGTNTLVIGPNPGNNGAPDQNCGNIAGVQNTTAQSRVLTFSSTPSAGMTILDMSPVYPNATQVLRGLQLNRAASKPYVLVQDEIATTASTNIYWFMHFQYEAHEWINAAVLSGSTKATEIYNGQEMFLKILSPSNAYFYLTTATPLATSPNPQTTPQQNTNSTAGTYWKKLAIHYIPATTGTTTICVEMIPGSDPGSYPSVVPLATWAPSPTPTPTPSPTPTPTPAPTPTISIGNPSTSGTLQITINGSVGHTYEIEASVDLINWTPIYTTVNPVVPFTWVDSGFRNYSARFYRVIQDP